MTPNGITARPSFASMPGMIVCNGRLPGAMALGWPGVGAEPDAAVVQHHAALRRHDAAAETWNSELMNEMALPSRSTTQR